MNDDKIVCNDILFKYFNLINQDHKETWKEKEIKERNVRRSMYAASHRSIDGNTFD